MNRRTFISRSAMCTGAMMTLPWMQKLPVVPSSPPYIFPNYQLKEIYFSMAGSYLTISISPRNQRLFLRTCRRSAVSLRDDKYWAHDYYELALTKGNKEIVYETVAFPWGLELKAAGVEGRIAFADPETLLLEIKGAAVHFIPMQPVSWHYTTAEGLLCLLLFKAQCVHHFRALSPAGIVVREGLPPFTEGTALSSATEDNQLIALRESRAEMAWNEPLPAMDNVWRERKKEIDQWMEQMPEVPEEFINGARMAWFILWNCRVNPRGPYTRPAILMSKNWMNQVWSWDNCFNALAVAYANPSLAWDQLLLMFDHQLDNGALPDAVNDLDIVTGYVKPPVYGWTIRKLIDITGLEQCKPYLQEIYPMVARQTEWWFTFRDYNKNGLCAYLHGNDSGWDNATVFDQGYPTEGADLAAHLALQTETLADMAEILGKGSGEVAMWRSLSQKQMNLLLTKCVSGGRFISPLEATGKASPSASLLNYIPVVLGRRLPKDLLAGVVKDLSPGGPFLTSYGLATESPGSPKYQPDGYWRGPIWAPSTYLIVDGLIDAGEIPLATEIALRFCRMCEKEPGMWENYNALTGKGLRAPAYTWTASVFILLASWLKEQS